MSPFREPGNVEASKRCVVVREENESSEAVWSKVDRSPLVLFNCCHVRTSTRFEPKQFARFRDRGDRMGEQYRTCGDTIKLNESGVLCSGM